MQTKTEEAIPIHVHWSRKKVFPPLTSQHQNVYIIHEQRENLSLGRLHLFSTLLTFSLSHHRISFDPCLQQTIVPSSSFPSHSPLQIKHRFFVFCFVFKSILLSSFILKPIHNSKSLITSKIPNLIYF